MNITIKGISPKLAKSLCGNLKVERISPRPEGLVDIEATLLSNETITIYCHRIDITTTNKQFVISRLDFVEVSIL